MQAWKFAIQQAGSERVQGAGLRPFIVSFMLERGLERGDAINSEDGKGVSVLVECGNKKAATDFRRTFANELKCEARSPYSMLPKKFKLSSLEKQNFNSQNHALLPALCNKAPAITLSQTSKGVGVMVALHKEMREGFESLSGELREGFEKLSETLPERIAKAIAGVKSVH